MAKVLQLRRGTTAENKLFTGALAEVTYDTTRKELRTHDGATAGGSVVGSILPGCIITYGGSSAPDGWLKCDGSAVSRTTYADLFAVIGTTYGAGNGSTTFNLPPAHVNPLGLYAGVFSAKNNKRISYDVGDLTGGSFKVIGISDIDRYTSVWTNATSGEHHEVFADAQGTAAGSGAWANMYSNNATASGALAINIIKY